MSQRLAICVFRLHLEIVRREMSVGLNLGCGWLKVLMGPWEKDFEEVGKLPC